MQDDPEFDNEFYDCQIKLMCKRYKIIFDSWRIDWESYYEDVRKKLRYRQYWIWIFLCGIDRFIKENKSSRLQQETQYRISRIIGQTFQIESYIKSL